MAFYRRLGLDFERIQDDKLRLVFTLLDPARPDAKCAFTLWVTPTEAYAVDDVEPALPAPQLAALLQELNAGNDFSGFVQKMRRAFKQLLLAAGA